MEKLVGKALRVSPAISKGLLKKFLFKESLYFLPRVPETEGSDQPPAEANLKRKRDVQPPV